MDEPFARTLARNLTISVLVGAGLAVFRHAPARALPGTLLALWPSLGGHFVEVAFLSGVRPRLPPARSVQLCARLAWWLCGGALLGAALIATAHLLPIPAPPWRWWWMGAPLFVGIELIAHGVLALRGRPNFCRGDS